MTLQQWAQRGLKITTLGLALASLGACSGDDVADQIEDALDLPQPTATPAPTPSPSPAPSGSPSPTPAPTLPDGAGAGDVGRLAYFVNSDPEERLEVVDLDSSSFIYSKELDLNGSSSMALARNGSVISISGSEQLEGGGNQLYCLRVALDQNLLEDDCLAPNAIIQTVIGLSDDGVYTGLLWLDLGTGLYQVGRWSPSAGLEVFGGIDVQTGLAVLSPDGEQIFVEENANERVHLVSFTSAGPTGLRLQYPAAAVGSDRSSPNTRMQISSDGQRLLTSVILDTGRTAGLSVDLASNATTIYPYPARIRALRPDGLQIFGVQAENGEALFFNFGNAEASSRIEANGEVDYLSWSPDSSRVVFRDGSRDIYRSTVARLPNGDGLREDSNILNISRIEWGE